MTTTNTTARITVAAGLATVGAFLLLPSVAGAEVIDGNPGCADLAPDGETWVEYKIDSNPDDGDHVAGDATITVAHPDEFSVSWTSTEPVVAFIMKGGPNADVQLYDPAVLQGSGTTPINDHGDEDPANDSPYGISHVTWCFPTDDPPETTTTTVPETTTTVPETTTTAPPEVAPTTLVQSVTTVPTEVLGVQQTRALPRTGSSDGALAVAGAAAILVGTAALLRSRRVEASHFDF